MYKRNIGDRLQRIRFLLSYGPSRYYSCLAHNAIAHRKISKKTRNTKEESALCDLRFWLVLLPTSSFFTCAHRHSKWSIHKRINCVMFNVLREGTLKINMKCCSNIYFLLLPYSGELAPILERRALCSVSWSFTGGRTPRTGDQFVARLYLNTGGRTPWTGDQFVARLYLNTGGRTPRTGDQFVARLYLNTGGRTPRTGDQFVARLYLNTGGRTPRTGDQFVARLYLNTGKCGHTLNIHTQDGIRTCNRGLLEIKDCSCLRPLVYRDRLLASYTS
jgi:hypothetical protein